MSKYGKSETKIRLFRVNSVRKRPKLDYSEWIHPTGTLFTRWTKIRLFRSNSRSRHFS